MTDHADLSVPASQPNPSAGHGALRCDSCGRFTSALNAVWCNPPSGGIDREICDDCFGAATSPVVSSSRAVDLDLDQIEARANAATARPWDHKGWHRSPHGESYAVWRGKPEGSYPIAQTERGLQGWHDAEFIAHAREDVPALVDALRAAYARIAELESACRG